MNRRDAVKKSVMGMIGLSVLKDLGNAADRGYVQPEIVRGEGIQGADFAGIEMYLRAYHRALWEKVGSKHFAGSAPTRELHAGERQVHTAASYPTGVNGGPVLDKLVREGNDRFDIDSNWLAHHIENHGLKGFYHLHLPRGIFYAARADSPQLSLRACMDYDINTDRYFLRVDFLGTKL